MRFEPTINEEDRIGGRATFGAGHFTPEITNFTITDATVLGTYQRLGRMVFFAITYVADAGSVQTASSVFTPPFTASTYFRGMLHQGTGVVAQNDNGTFTLNNGTVTNDRFYITGHYWID